MSALFFIINKMKEIFFVTLKGGLKGKVFTAITVVALIFNIFIIPAVSLMSMRLVAETAITIFLSLVSFVLIILTIFLGVNLIFADIERNITFTVLSLPITRSQYIFGKFYGLVGIVLACALILFCSSFISITISSIFYPPVIPISWLNIFLALFFNVLKMAIIGAFSIFFSSFSTNLFLPLFATVGIYIIGSMTQEIMNFINTPYGMKLPAITQFISKGVYYIFPNLELLDLKAKAIYSLPLGIKYIFFSIGYSII